MCDPVTLTALTVGSGLLGAAGQFDAASANNKAAGKTAQAQADEFAASRDEQLGERVRQSRRERGRQRVSAGEAGVAGNSFESLLKNSLGAQNRDIAIAQKQGGFTQRSLQSEVDIVAARNQFSPLSAGLQIAASGATSFAAAGGKNPFAKATKVP